MDFANAIDGQRAMNEVDGDRSKGGLRVREFKPMGNRSVLAAVTFTTPAHLTYSQV